MDLENYLLNYLLSKNNSRDLEKFNHLTIKLDNNINNFNTENIINLIIKLKSLYGFSLDISNNLILSNKKTNLEIHKKKNNIKFKY